MYMLNSDDIDVCDLLDRLIIVKRQKRRVKQSVLAAMVGSEICLFSASFR